MLLLRTAELRGARGRTSESEGLQFPTGNNNGKKESGSRQVKYLRRYVVELISTDSRKKAQVKALFKPQTGKHVLPKLLAAHI